MLIPFMSDPRSRDSNNVLPPPRTEPYERSDFVADANVSSLGGHLSLAHNGCVKSKISCGEC
jgi:hypothetical protein